MALPPVALSTHDELRAQWQGEWQGLDGTGYVQTGKTLASLSNQTADLFDGGLGVLVQWAKKASWRGRLRAVHCV